MYIAQCNGTCLQWSLCKAAICLKQPASLAPTDINHLCQLGPGRLADTNGGTLALQLTSVMQPPLYKGHICRYNWSTGGCSRQVPLYTLYSILPMAATVLSWCLLQGPNAPHTLPRTMHLHFILSFLCYLQMQVKLKQSSLVCTQSKMARKSLPGNMFWQLFVPT